MYALETTCAMWDLSPRDRGVRAEAMRGMVETGERSEAPKGPNAAGAA